MDREISSCRLTDQQLEALGNLSIDYGLTNRELNRRLKESNISSNLTEQEINKALEKIEKNEGNCYRTVTRPLLSQNIIYKTKGKYPNEPLYINKFIDNMNKIQHTLADPIDGRIWHYDRVHYIEGKKMGLGEIPSEEHVKAHGLLAEFTYLYIWCDQIKREINEVVETYRGHFDSFCLVAQIPPCKICLKIQRNVKVRQYFQDLNRVLWKQAKIHSRDDLRELVREFKLIKDEKELRALGLPTVEELAEAIRPDPSRK
jgi:hypothetical protein